MRKAENLDNKILAIRRAEEDENRRHKQALQTLRDQMNELSRYCDHEWQYGDAQSYATCKRCGQEDEGPGGYEG